MEASSCTEICTSWSVMLCDCVLRAVRTYVHRRGFVSDYVPTRYVVLVGGAWLVDVYAAYAAGRRGL